MVPRAVITSLLAAAAVFANNVAPGRRTVPGAYIFEFEDGHDSRGFVQTLAGDGTDTRRVFDYPLFKGISVQFHHVQTARVRALQLAQQPVIKNVWPVQLFPVPDDRVEWTAGDVSHQSPEAAAAGFARDVDDDFSTHRMTQVDKLRAQGITGKNIKIAVVDTGIDYLHPALGGCFGKDCLVSFGTDLVGDAFNGTNTPMPDNDPMDCAGHGTHVAGIIAAQANNPFNFTGAAPDVTLGAYRVFGCRGDVGNDILIDAFNRAHQDGADIITASIGGASGWSEDPWAVVVSRIVAAGVPCTIAAGNDGANGLFYASGAADGNGVTAIGSVDNIYSLAVSYLSTYSVDGAANVTFGYTPGKPENWEGVQLPLFALNLDTSVPDDACKPLPATTPNLSDKIVLVRRGTCSFVQKAQNLAARGARYLFLYNNGPGTISVDVSPVPQIRSVAMVDATMGASWIADLQAGRTITLSLLGRASAPRNITSSVNSVTGGAMSTFTSWGPTWEMQTKPQFSAPGGSILSTWPRALGSYAVLSGTSMATPLAAAVYALIAQVRGSFDPALIENLLSATSRPVRFNDGNAFHNYLAPVAQQGAGLIQAYDAAYATTLLCPSSLSFNDTDHAVAVRNFTIRNTGHESATFSISHIPTDSFFTLPPTGDAPAVFPNEAIDRHASLRFSESKLGLDAGEQVVISVFPTPPADIDARRLALWSGYIAVNGSDGSSFTLPYQGLSGSLHSHIVLNSTGAWIANSSDDSHAPVANGTAFPIPAPGKPTAGVVLPEVVVGLMLGSAQIRADIVSLNTTGGPATTDVFGTKSIGQPFGFPQLFAPRGTNRGTWGGQLNTGDYAPPGSYKIVVRALRIFGDTSKESDWDLTETMPFSIRYE